jgi:dolichol kinase
MTDFIWFQTSLIASLFSIQYGTGLLVRHKGIRVNYTRKINHFALFFVPVFLRSVFPHEPSFLRFIFGCVLGTFILFIYIKPIRDRLPLIATMFLSFDRPEDRPNTLWWLFTQILAGYMVLVPAVILFVQNDLAGIIWIPLLINIFGDGLAEPVGIRFGRHTYRTYAFFSKKKYVRSLEGSACVLLASIFIVIVFHASFTPIQFILALIFLPLLMTFVEAFSPHTWDTPTLNIAGYGALYAITRITY